MSDNNIASLGLRVDSSQVVAAVTPLDNLAASANKAAAAETNLANASASASTQLHASVQDAVKYATAQNSASTAQQQAFALIQQNIGAQRALAGTQQTTSQATQAATLSAKQYAQALRQVPAQLTDIVTQLAGGQSPLLVLLQQGGQLKDSFGGIGAAARALLGAISPVALGVGSLAAVGALAAKAFNDGEREAYEFQKAIILSGNAAGVTTSELASMAKELDRLGDTRGAAAGALATAVSTGKIATTSLQQVAQAALALERTAGVPIEKTIAEFAALGGEPVKAAEQLQQKYNFLTVAVLDQARALENSGKTAEATALLQQQLVDATLKRTDELTHSLGVLPGAWQAVAKAARETWDAMLNVGRPESPQEELDRLNAQLRSGVGKISATAANLGIDPGLSASERAGLNAQANQLLRVINAQNRAAAAAAGNAGAVQADAVARAQSEAQRQADQQIDAARLQANLADVQRVLSASAAAQSTYEQVLEAQRHAGLVSESSYYDARRGLIDADRIARTQALNDEIALLDKERDRLKASQEAASNNPNLNEVEKLKARLAIEPQLIANASKRKDLEEQLSETVAKSSSATEALGIEQKSALNGVAAGYQSARDAAQAYLETIQRRQQIELQGAGLGDRERQRLSGRADIGDRYDEQRQRLASDRAEAQIQAGGQLTADAKKHYDDQLAIINEFQGKALHSYDDYWAQLTEKQGSFFVGAAEALSNYIDESKNTAGQVAAALSKGLNDATDALVKFVTTGKGSFRDLANSIIADLLRISLQEQAGGLLGLLRNALPESLGGAITPVTVTAHAGGGDVSAGRPILVGEKGPEVIVPRTPGTVIPNNQIGSYGGTNVTIHQHLQPAPGTNVAETLAIVEAANRATESRIYDMIRRGQWDSAFAHL